MEKHIRNRQDNTLYSMVPEQVKRRQEQIRWLKNKIYAHKMTATITDNAEYISYLNQEAAMFQSILEVLTET